MCYFNGHVIDLGKVDEQALAVLTDKVLSNGHLWDVENEKKRNKLECLTETRHIIFQFPASLQNHAVSKYTPLWDEWKSVLEPVIDGITKLYPFEDGKTARIMLANIIPGGQIGKHVDEYPAADVPHKIHVPLKTDESVYFIEEDSAYYLQRGNAYEVNNKVMHGVMNKSENERIHLIFDYYDAAVS